ncbi:non-homologous end-joining factor 1 [Galdieria sulphuraria]|uniref:Non-homologous end-joining factor 1 n=1 Tax=Galdieria sulphuraria TaxID=130081 RepID=M2VXQ4_GALSU|nr:non-homologous end-joining factor 1 [Galdieria sulphuraria]EME28066.1 non-homologous end-joining factor 1 [Galdieria sulphuraria]|eukprot:XP_005704586.1 non-homologous end-joining factor 1 [Galdieria sulphuraria]
MIRAVDTKNSRVSYNFLLKESLEQFPFALLVTDCHDVWSQVSSTEVFRKQVQEFLPGFLGPSQPEQPLLDLIREKLLAAQIRTSDQENRLQFLADINDDILLLSLDIVLSEVSFTWTFRCTHHKQDCQLFLSELLVYPLLNTLKILNEEKYALVDIIARKDKEISEYKSFFGTIPKVSVSTQPFSLENFDHHYTVESYITNYIATSNTNDVWTLHTSQLFASVIALDENQKQKLSKLLGQNVGETVDSTDSTVQSELKMETHKELKVSRENLECEDSLIDQSFAGRTSDEQKQPTELRTRSKLLKTMSSEERVGENVKKKKRLF